MKKILIYSVFVLLLLVPSCDLDLYPETGYNEGNVQLEEDDKESQISTRKDLEGIRNSIYSWGGLKNIQEKGFMDWMVYTECRADNAYAGSLTTGEVVALEANRQDGENKNVVRDWAYFLGTINKANQIICNIDRVKESDPSLSDSDYRLWLSEAYCWRALNVWKMSLLFGDIPFVESIPPAIDADNVTEVYDQYFPARSPMKDNLEKVVSNLEYAVENLPDNNPANKSVFTKAFALGMLARIHAEEVMRDWEKVAECCSRIEGMGYSLEEDYGRLWGYDENDAFRRSCETILEVPFSRSSGNWVFMMFHRNAYNKDDSYTWQKWITPSRDLIRAFDAENDVERKNACIVWDECTWSDYYPNTEYAFMHKVPTNASSIIIMRLGEIYLLHAEALANLGRFKEATDWVNIIRKRAGISLIQTPSSKDEMIKAVLNERRLELAFEGFRFFDLNRYGTEYAAKIIDDLYLKDNHWQRRLPLTEESKLLPVPQTAIDNNPSLIQNPGY